MKSVQVVVEIACLERKFKWERAAEKFTPTGKLYLREIRLDCDADVLIFFSLIFRFLRENFSALQASAALVFQAISLC